MKKIIFTILVFVAFISFNACENEDNLIFTAEPSPEGVEFITSVAGEYLISGETEGNVAERFVWNVADFGAETNINYDLEGSTSNTFDTIELLGTTNQTNLSITIDQLLGFAETLGLDDDPSTTDGGGQPNNIGEIFVRLKAYPGSGTGNTVEVFSGVQALAIRVLEKTGDTGCSSIYALGDAVQEVGWNWVPETEIFCEADILQAKYTFVNGQTFRFFETFGDWDSGLNYTYFIDEGYTIDAGFEDAGDGDNNFLFIGDTGIYTLMIDNVTKEMTLTPSGSLWAVGDATPGAWDFAGGETEIVEISPNVWQATFALSTGVFRFFQTQGIWDTNNNYAFYEDEGYTIDSSFESDGGADANFSFIGTPGTYTLTINSNEKTITLE